MARVVKNGAGGLNGSKVWAITTYFNPIHYESRLHNFRLFRDALSVPLIAVELGYDAEYELRHRDAEVLVRVSALDVLWQKERLLNLALAQVPGEAEVVCWFDCDVLLERRDWPRAALAAVGVGPVIQLFSELHDLPQGALPADLPEPRLPTGYGIAHLMATGKRTLADLDPSVVSSRARQTAWGLAWAARKSILLEHAFYDALVVGSGDRAMACAAFGRLDNPIAVTKMNACQRAHYLRWAEPFHRAVNGKVGCIEGRLYHLWHGAFENRQYRQRHEAFAAYAFDPATDLVINESGAYEWAAHRRDLANFCRSYFASRLEDGVSPNEVNVDPAGEATRNPRYLTVVAP